VGGVEREINCRFQNAKALTTMAIELGLHNPTTTSIPTPPTTNGAPVR